MPRITGMSVEELIRNAIAPVVQKASSQISRAIAARVVAEIEAQVRKAAPRGTRSAARRSGTEMTRWVADRRARRVPTFVIEATGLDTKKKIVAKYGPDATFEKGKPLPPIRASGIATPSSRAARVVKARPPIIRKGAARKIA